jgi:predicted homoserine dehydrogenase-like protein
VLFNDAALAPRGGPVVEVVATAKTYLKKGEIIDPIGHFMTYGQCENAEVVQAQRLLPMGAAQGCRLKRDISRDQVLTIEDVDIPEGRLTEKLRAEQEAYFAQSASNVSITR